MNHAWYVTYEVPTDGTLLKRRHPRLTQTFETEAAAKDFARKKNSTMDWSSLREPSSPTCREYQSRRSKSQHGLKYAAKLIQINNSALNDT